MLGPELILAELIIRVITGCIASAIASSKGRSPVGWFFGGFFIFILGIIIVACLSNLKEEQAHRDHQNRENRRLREQLRQERLKAEAFRQHTFNRLDAHDQQLGVDTKQTYNVLPLHQAEAQPLLEARSDLDDLADASAGMEPAPLPMHAAPSPHAAPHAASPPPPSARQWHYEANGQAQGPVPEPQLLAMMRAGQIHAGTLLWTEELGDWKAANQISALRPFLKQ